MKRTSAGHITVEPVKGSYRRRPIARTGRLRTKFLLSLILVSASLTCSTLLVVQHRIKNQVRNQIREGLENSLVTFQHFQRQRESTLEAGAALLANLPILKALMTSSDPATIQDGSVDLWKQTGGDLFLLADRTGKLVAVHTRTLDFTAAQARESLARSLRNGEPRDWWSSGGHLFQVFIQPIYFGTTASGTELGVLVLGYEISQQLAEDVGRVASSQVAFRSGPSLDVSTLSAAQNQDFLRLSFPESSEARAETADLHLGGERFLAAATDLQPGSSAKVSLVVLESYDQATVFLRSLNRWLAGLGLVAILAGSLLVFLISHTFTRPLAELVGGVHALERGDINYPLEARGNDEVSELTRSFDRMRSNLMRAQQELLQAERLATIGRMASTISHDLRHSLSAILANAEFLSEGTLKEGRRLEYYHEVRQAVNQMTGQLQALLEFSKPGTEHRPVRANIASVVARAVRAVKARPEFSGIQVSTTVEGGAEAWIDPGRMERVFHNLLLNACEAVPPESGRVDVTIRQDHAGLEVLVSDNGRGIPDEIRDRLFQPFVTAGKENGIGLGLTVVQKIVQEHGGQVNVERTSPEGTVLSVSLPVTVPEPQVASQRG